MKNILFFLPLILLPSCMFWDIPPVIPDDPEPLEIDCQNYIEYNDPFMVAKHIFDIVPNDLVFFNYLGQIDIFSLYPSVEVYHNGKYLTIVVDGSITPPPKRIFIRDGNGTKYALTFEARTSSYYGAVTYEEHKILLTRHKSPKLISFYGTSYDSIRYDTLIGISLDTCIAGGIRYDMRYNQVSQDRIDQCITHGWDQVIQ